MFAAVSLGVFDLLDQGSQSASGLARATDTSEDALKRLLDACVGLGLLAKNGESYSNLPIAQEYLRRESPRTLTGYILYSDQVLFPMWANLETAVREGSHRWKQTFGLDGPIFSHFFKDPAATKTFLDGMHGFGLLSSPGTVSVFNLNRFRHMVDLGGGTGHLAIAACERYGGLRATVFDLPGAIEHARVRASASRAKDRISFAAGDFFRDALPEADLYAVGRIFHDWTEAKIRILLGKIRTALPAGGGLLIAEKLLDEDGSGPVSAQMQSLNMLVCTEGKERTLSGYRALLAAEGFVDVEGRKTGTPLDAVLAFKTAT
jgi:acetylserotonin O-methyltransferase